MKKIAIIVAGGRGIRMGGDEPKQFRLLKGRPLIWYSIKAFVAAYPDIKIILVLPSEYLGKAAEISQEFSASIVGVTAGGDTRFQSVKNGLQLVENDCLVFAHDAARCLVSSTLIRLCGEAAMDKGNAVPAISATDSIRIETTGGNERIDRDKIRIIQTPQVFLSKELKKAYEQPYENSFSDEATVVEKLGIRINLIEGEKTNFKITSPPDLILAENLLP